MNDGDISDYDSDHKGAMGIRPTGGVRDTGHPATHRAVLPSDWSFYVVDGFQISNWMFMYTQYLFLVICIWDIVYILGTVQ